MALCKPPFQHVALDRKTRETRLVRFETSPELAKSEDVTLELHLEHVSRVGNPEYAALSYVWGTAASPALVKINGRSLSVGQNLCLALRRLCADGVSTWLWIDAICINQNDDDEKSWLVNEMKEIFEQATMTYIWLGPAADDSDFIMDRLTSIGQEAIAMGIEKWISLPEQTQIQALRQCAIESFPELLVSQAVLAIELPTNECEKGKGHQNVCKFLTRLYFMGSNDLVKRTKEALTRLLHRDLWHRVWIFQEIAVAKRSVLLCGEQSMPVHLFEAAIDAFHGWDNLLLNVNFKILPKIGGREIMPIEHGDDLIQGIRLRRAFQLGMRPSLVTTLLCGLATRKRPAYSATDPRDIIFSLLGVTNSKVDLGLSADYGKSVVQVFCETMRSMITINGWEDLWLLAYPKLPQKIVGLPSWVIDWVRMGTTTAIELPVDFRRDFNASGTKKQPSGAPGFNEAGDFLVLRLHGTGITTASEVLMSSEQTQHPGPGPGSAQDFAGCTTTSSQDSWRILIRVLFLDQTPLEWTSIVKDNIWFSLAQRVLEDVPIEPEDLTAEEASYLMQYRVYTRGVPSIKTDIEEFRMRVNLRAKSNVSQRAMFKTAEGGLGLGPKNMQAGDMLAIVWGLQVPIVVRPRGDGCVDYVGDAYMDGVMRGEFLETEFREEVFDLA